MDIVLVRLFLIVFVTFTCYWLRPFGPDERINAAIGAILGAAIIIFEWRLHRVSLKRLIGAAMGSILGIFGAYLFALIIHNSFAEGRFRSFLEIMVMLLMAYVGLIVGANKGDLLNLAALGGVFGGEKQHKKSYKILDTSVIIDGRIADIAETGFLDGTVVTPQFVLRELQLVADSADPLKRNRGRRGLDILQRLQNKVAQLQGVQVLNINELANALKPIVLPGEIMRVFILKEGKEYNQGVAYLDDGTMVVVDNARKMIGKTVDISVTSVLQTTAGKMIFGKWDERSGSRSEPRAPVSVANVPVVETKRPIIPTEQPAE